MRNISGKHINENLYKHIILKISFQTSSLSWNKVERCGSEGYDTDDNKILRMRLVCWMISPTSKLTN
jgi:hypothetical protein